MTALYRAYLSDLAKQLFLEPPHEREILDELRGHIEDKAAGLRVEGVSPEEADARAIYDLGASGSIASALYAVHTQTPWQQTLLAALPHLLLAFVFALGLWTAPAWIVILVVVATLASVFGWMRGRPNWSYPWLGYCLIAPIASWGLAMSAVVYGAWSVVTKGTLPLGFPIYVACFAYIAFSMWAVVKIVSRIVRRDWLMASLAVLPFPFLAYWFLYFYNPGEIQRVGQEVPGVDTSAAVIFLVLAAATAVFFRIGRRLFRVALLVITVPSMIVLAWLSYQGGPGYMALFAFCALSLALLLTPALLDRNIRRPEELWAIRDHRP